MNNSSHFEQLPFLTNEEVKQEIQIQADDVICTLKRNTVLPPFTYVGFKEIASIGSSIIRVPGDLFSDLGLNTEATVNFLRKAIKLLHNFSQKEEMTFLHAMGLSFILENEGGHTKSGFPIPSSETSDLNPNLVPSALGWSFYPNTATYNGHTFCIQGVPLEILKALSRSPRGISSHDLMNQVWPRKFVNGETLRSHICSIRKCIKETLNVADDPVPHIGSGDTSGYRLNFELLKINAGDHKV
ncbi:MAG: hypothetical protein CME31_21560 [Gimesia sp.]|uniref:OmpR/PhoB-type domain-containing protein n=1 Tax=Gimesia maris TaxID=122 RepID=A0A3D3R044_9PLAN|nr:hypothetical protein [Gimesia sp.]HCO22214.1 hypothetical protein [Gimesia maris]|tara:strand:+ start:94966 stop:95694 length:729 start_codon:yes stop_codon:yes gene_type:complete